MSLWLWIQCLRRLRMRPSEVPSVSVPSAEGGFGLVFKGWIDENSLTAAKSGTGMAIAVKRLNQGGLHGQREWLAEVNSIGKLHHPNLVRLIGYFQSQPLPWSLRIKIALGSAKGLAFLHSDEAKVIYGNFKTSKILLDSNYNAKLSGYGLAKEGLQGFSMLRLSDCSCSNSNKFYHEEGIFSEKSDVYSFGVLILAIISGR
ncbi:unnamed protein product, partial [Prunus brigantina]